MPIVERLSLVVVLSASSVLGCSGPAVERSEIRQQAVISDQGHNNGSVGFFFLPPIVAGGEPKGTVLETSVSVSVKLDELDVVTGNVRRNLLTFAPSDIRVTGGGYQVDWTTAGVNASLRYRISVFDGGRGALGYADVAFSAGTARPGDVVLNVSQTLPIRFWIERSDVDGDGRSDVGGVNAADNCPTTANPDQVDSVGNGIGDACRCLTVTCAALDQCHAVGACSPTSGQCPNPAKPEGVACNDGNACTRLDVCQVGVCRGGNPIVCAAVDQCHVAGVCDTVIGVCSNPSAADGTGCNDAVACTPSDTCQQGSCVGSGNACAAPSACQTGGACNLATGGCVYTNKPEGSACAVATSPNAPATCQSGGCKIPPPPVPSGCHASEVFDPHIVTMDGLYYDFQGAGEFVLAQSTQGLLIQVRQEGVAPNVTVPTAIATQVGASQVGFYASQTPPLLVDGVPTIVPLEGLFFAGGGRIDRSGDEYTIAYGTGESLVLRAFPALMGAPLSVNFCVGGAQPTVEGGGIYRGLVGNFDGNPNNDLTPKNGNVLVSPVSFTALNGDFGNSWRINESESLFSYAPGSSTGSYQNTAFAQTPVNTAQLSVAIRDEARATCLAAGVSNPYLLDGCILDVGLTADPGYAAGYGGVAIPTTILDFDFDGVADYVDTCPSVPNANQLDANHDGNGDACSVSLLTFPTPAVAVAAGTAIALTASAIAADGSGATDVPVTYVSSNPAVGTIDAMTGLFTGLSGGTTTITATSGGGSASTLCVVYGGSGSSSAVVLTGQGIPGGGFVGPGDSGGSGASGAVLQVAQSIELVATFNVINTPPSNLTGYFQWVSNNPSVALVSSSGIVTSVGVGMAVITGSLGGLTATFTIAVAGTQDLGLLPGATSSDARDINASGVVVGCSGNRPFSWNGAMHELPLLAGTSGCCANGINGQGDIVGTCGTSGVRWDGSSGAVSAITNALSAQDINDSGFITGTARTQMWNGIGFQPARAAYRYTPATGLTILPWFGGAWTLPDGTGYAVNAAGTVAGSTTQVILYSTCGGCGFQRNDTQRGFTYDGTMRNLGANTIPPYYLGLSEALGINAASTAVGWAEFYTEANHAVIFTAGAPLARLPLGLPGTARSVAHAIDDQAIVVGEYTLAGTTTKAFLWKQGAATQQLAPLPGGTTAAAKALTNVGVGGFVAVVGSSSSASGQTHAIRWILAAP